MTCLACGIVLYRRDDGAVRLLLLRNAETGLWGFAKGRREPDDAHEIATALREVREETGFEVAALHGGFRHVIEYAVRDDDGESYPKRVTYFLAEAPRQAPRLSDEHSAAAWVDGDEALARVQFGTLKDLVRAALTALDAP